MRRRTRAPLLFTLALALTLSACGASSPAPTAGETAAETAPPLEAPGAPVSGGEAAESFEHGHTPAEESLSTEHKAEGYCGNTVTTLSCTPRDGSEPWSVSFWGGDSVELTDFLRFLDCSGEICRCLPEYTVETEFGGPYGVSLEDCYVRLGEGQAALTEEEAGWMQDLFDRQAQAAGDS